MPPAIGALETGIDEGVVVLVDDLKFPAEDLGVELPHGLRPAGADLEPRDRSTHVAYLLFVAASGVVNCATCSLHGSVPAVVLRPAYLSLSIRPPFLASLSTPRPKARLVIPGVIRRDRPTADEAHPLLLSSATGGAIQAAPVTVLHRGDLPPVHLGQILGSDDAVPAGTSPVRGLTHNWDLGRRVH
jgi:hypothetical protein